MATGDGEHALPNLWNLHTAHRGLTPEVGHYYAQAASVLLSKHHQPPTTLRVDGVDLAAREYILNWPVALPDWIRAWNNRQDAVRDGAYSVVLAATEASTGLVAIERAEEGTGADYYVGPPGSFVNPADGLLDLENATRLEISGIDSGGEAELNRRIKEKIEQACRGVSDLPAMAGVVGFRLRRVVLRMVP